MTSDEAWSAPPLPLDSFLPLEDGKLDDTMVNFRCQLDVSMGCPDIVQMKHCSVGMSLRVLWVRLIFESVDRIRHIYLPTVGGHHPIN